MFVGDRMSRPVISVPPQTSIYDALALFKRERIRRAPVIKDGKMVGFASEKDLLNASPSPVTSLSVWEMNYLLSKVTVKSVMTRKVKTVEIDTPIEEAARIMADNKIGGLPVMRAGIVVGIITETDLFKVFLELMGARDKRIRVTALIDDKPGQLAKVTKAMADAGGNFISFGFFAGEDTSTKMLTFKAEGMKKDDVRKSLVKHLKNIRDVRQS